ncbi:ELMO domain-containing protein A isoform X2 [Prunus dulcis]|uniref:ELMO domain-containing protein A isoform X2 n=1 Tax=Prunus dulcis TaxID=3755 RepID=UPI001482C16C|nr:ELMO domain-containing protein A isoform X2 [Prunus dulcis]
MTSRTLRKRLHHGDVDGKKNEHLETSGSDDLNEPLLGNYYSDTHAEGSSLEETCDDERRKEYLHWTLLFSQLIAQWARWLVVPVLHLTSNVKLLNCLKKVAIFIGQANIVLGSGSLIGQLLTFPSTTQNGQSTKLLAPPLSPLQEARLRKLRQRLEVPFDGSRVEHQDALLQLWRLAYPDKELPPLKSELWKQMGWQGSDPSTDFRGGGFISLENLIFFAQQYPESFQRLLHKQDGTRAEWEYPFAVAGINISFVLAHMLDLQSEPASLAGIRFLELLQEDEMAFDNLYCVAFQMMDAQWLAKRASYMEFNDVLKSTRSQLERELALEDVSSVKDLPAYNMLRR